MATRSPDEVRAEYISSMGQELGDSFYELYRELVELHIVWQQYRQLFGSDFDTVQLLNRSAGLFFKVVQDELWDSVLLGISRMTDPPATGRNKNLTIQSLPLLLADPVLAAEVQDLCSKAVTEAEFAREHRNKRIAHQDHNYLSNRSSNPLSGISRARVEDMLAALRAALNRLDNHFRDSTMMYEDFIDTDGARLLVHKLKKLERLQAESASAP
ncbi:AbiU2 domain-containing protein [Lysobacter terrae]